MSASGSGTDSGTTSGSAASVRHAWLGDGAVLATLHLPSTDSATTATTGVVLCAPIGHEQTIAYRTQRLLAESLADGGVAVVRFDHAGFGDSTVKARGDSLRQGPRLAAEALRGAGCARIVYAGFGSGALVAADAAEHDPDASGLLLIDSPASGKQWLRRATSLYAVALGDEAEPPADGDTTIAGADLGPDLVAAISALTLDLPLLRARGVPTAALVRRGLPVAAALRRLAPHPDATAPVGTTATDDEADGSKGFAELIETDALPSLLDASSVTSRIPGPAVIDATTWILRLAAASAAEGSQADGGAAASAGAESVEFPSDGALLRERVVHVGEHRLFGIETVRVGAAPGGPAVLLHNGSSEHRIGASRHQVVLARRLAALGIRVLRVDRRGTGESGQVSADEPDLLYSEEWLEDNAAAVRYLDTPAERFGIVGLCVGAWLGLRADSEARFIVALSSNDYRTVTVPHDAVADGERSVQGEWTPRLRDRLMTLAKERLPYRILLAMARRGLVQFVEPVLDGPLRRGTDVLLVLGPTDTGLFADRRGATASARLDRLPGRLRVVNLDRGDHSLFSPGIRNRSLDEAVAEVERCFGPLLRASHPAPGVVVPQ